MSEPSRPISTEKVSHTPGPWTAERNDDDECYSIGTRANVPVGQRSVCLVHFGYDEPAESEQHANARLIAAAPELLAACKALDVALCNGFDTQDDRMAGRKALIAAREAVAKAEGKSHV